MKNTLTLFLGFLVLSIIAFSCQKEKSTEQGQVAQGSLQSDLDECLPKTIHGTYIVNQNLADSNYIEVEVQVEQTGNYTIITDTVNGYSFKGTGKFSAVGSNTVQLKGNGKPLAVGINQFTVLFDSTFCTLEVEVVAGGSSGGTAVYALQGSGGACMNATVNGTYTQGTALTTSNTVTISVNVTTAGTWNITTPSVGGFSFSGSGTFSTTGVQNITLNGTGNPASGGTQTFSVNAGGGSCTFAVTVTGGAVAGDYFPRTANSNWSYEYDDNPLDSLLIKANASTITIAGNTYNVFMLTGDATLGFDTSGYYRKSGGDYFTYIHPAIFFATYTGPRIEYIFLKDNQAANFSWTSPAFSMSSVNFRLKLTILQKDVSINVNGTTFQNTIVVQTGIETNAGGATWTDITATTGSIKSYYAKGIGLIKEEYITPSGTEVLELRRHQVN